MRYLTAVLLLAASLPLAAGSGASRECQKRCKQEYRQCLKRANSQAASKTCAVLRDTCKLACGK
jgi:hypothetical protein